MYSEIKEVYDACAVVSRYWQCACITNHRIYGRYPDMFIVFSLGIDFIYATIRHLHWIQCCMQFLRSSNFNTSNRRHTDSLYIYYLKKRWFDD